VVAGVVEVVGEDEEVHVAAAEEEDGAEVSRCTFWISKGVICMAVSLGCLLGSSAVVKGLHEHGICGRIWQ
jgi:hypothetical protein